MSTSERRAGAVRTLTTMCVPRTAYRSSLAPAPALQPWRAGGLRMTHGALLCNVDCQFEFGIDYPLIVLSQPNKSRACVCRRVHQKSQGLFLKLYSCLCTPPIPHMPHMAYGTWTSIHPQPHAYHEDEGSLADVRMSHVLSIVALALALAHSILYALSLSLAASGRASGRAQSSQQPTPTATTERGPLTVAHSFHTS